MENKYYTPSIEEFYTGFEYERTVRVPYEDSDEIKLSPQGSWSKCSFPDFLNNHKYNLQSIINALQLDCIRVKYLDREDIESLGFKYEGVFRDGGTLGFVDRIYRLHFYRENRLITRPYTISIKDNNSQLFFGDIKNKSELKILLKQLGI